MFRIGTESRTPYPRLCTLALLALSLSVGIARAQDPIRSTQTLRLQDLASLPLKDGVPEAHYVVENESFEIALHLESLVGTEDGHLLARLECSHPVDIVRKRAKDFRRIRSKDFLLYGAGNPVRTALRLPREKVVCDLLLKKRGDEEFRAGIRIQSESPFASLDHDVRCPSIIKERPTATEYFDSSTLPMLGCDTEAESIELLSDPIGSFNRKVEALTGTPLPLDVIEHQDVDYPLDFSRAPKFDTLVVATMEFKIDFYGTTLAKIMKWHADHGTQVRVIVPAVPATFFPKDALFLQNFENQNRNFQVQLYKDTSTASKRLDRMHRVTHAKMVVGISSAEPHRSVSILGGRNVKDTFLFRSTPDYSKHPEMEQYGKLSSPFGFFDDLEVLVQGQQTAWSITRDFVSFWNRDSQSLRMRPAATHESSVESAQPLTTATGPRVRHILSVPFADGYQMEKLVVEMLGSARKTVRMVSPYFRPTPAIGRAILDAAARGVRIQFITELDLMKDNSPPITMGVNTQSVNQYRKDIEIYISKDEHAIIHSKVILVDDELLFVSGTNLNMRSFIHDVENGLLISDLPTATRFKELFENQYLPGAERVTEDLEVKFMDKLFIPLVDQYF